MKILFSPQVRENDRLVYSLTENRITVAFKGRTDTFDFSTFPDGELQIKELETNLEYQPFRKVEKVDGVLYVTLMNFISSHATEKERFPEWIDHTEYISAKVGEVNGQDEMEE